MKGTGGSNGKQPILIRRRTDGKTLSPEESARMEEEAKMRSINSSIKKAEEGAKRVIGQVQKILCKTGTITYAVKTEGESFTLSSKDFQSLTLTSHVENAVNAEVGCDADISGTNLVITYKPLVKPQTGVRGELVSLDFVPKNFRFIEAKQGEAEIEEIYETEAANQSSLPTKTENVDAQRRAAMMQGIKNALRQPLTGEKRELGFIEKVECGGKGIAFYIKNATQTFKLSAASPQAIQIKGFTPEIQQLQLGCQLKQVDIPVVFTYKENTDSKAKSNGELIALEFVPKSFVLEK
jgi:hypothetical protein